MTNRSKRDKCFEELLNQALAEIVAADCRMISCLDVSKVEISEKFDAKIRALIRKERRASIREAVFVKISLAAAFILALLPLVLFSIIDPNKAPHGPANTVTTAEVEETEAPETDAPKIVMTTYIADIGLYKTVNGQFFIAAYHNETGKVYAVESEPTATWSVDWPGNWVEGSEHGDVIMAVTQKPEGPGFFDMYPTFDGEYASVVAFEAPIDGTYSAETVLVKIADGLDAYVRLMKSDGTFLQEYISSTRGEYFILSATEVELKAKEQLLIVVDKAPDQTASGGYNVSFVSFTVTRDGFDATETENPPVTEPPVEIDPNEFISKTSFRFNGITYLLEWISGGDATFRNNRELAMKIRGSRELTNYLNTLKELRKTYPQLEVNINKIQTYFDNLCLYRVDGTISDYGKAQFIGYSDVLSARDEIHVMEKVSEFQGYTAEEIKVFGYRFWGNLPSLYEGEWSMIPELPILYQYVMWYSSAVEPVTVEELKVASDSIKDVWPDYCLTDEQIHVLVTLDEDAAKIAFANPAALVFDGEIYPLSKLISVDEEVITPIVDDTTRKMIGTDELKTYIETIRNFGFDAEDTEKYVKALTELYEYPEPDAIINRACKAADEYDHTTARELILSVSDDFTADELMDKAKALIDEKRFDAAYVILSVIDTDEAEELMKEFTLLKVTDSDSTYHYINTYDESGRLVKVQRKQTNIPGTDFEYEVSIIYTYNSLGQLIHERNTEDGLTEIDYTYDDEGRLSMQYYVESASQVPTVIVQTTYEYDNNSNLIKETVKYLDSPLKKVVTYEYEYNENNAVTKKTTTSYFEPGGFDGQTFENYTKDIEGITYEYDTSGNLIKETYTYHDYITDSKWNIIEETFSLPVRYRMYKYDEKGLKIEFTDSDPETNATYEYDSNNRLIYTERHTVNHYNTDESGNKIPVIYHYTTKYTYNELGLLTLQEMWRDNGNQYSFSYHYDCFGNQIKKIGHYSHDPNSLLSSVTYSYIIAE